MNLRDLEYLIALAEERHFRRAAQRCFVSQPALSNQIRKLEEHLDVELFERTRRSVRLTPVGARIVAGARDVLHCVAEIERIAASCQDPCSGPITLGVIPTIGPYLVPRVWPSLQRELPRLSMRVREGLTDEILAQVLAGELDAAIIATDAGDDGLVEFPVFDEPFRVALAAGHPLARRRSLSLKDLEAWQMLLLTDGHCLRDQALAVCGRGASVAGLDTRATSLEMILALVATGEATTLVPLLALDEADAPARGLCLKRLRVKDVQRRVRLVCRASFPRREAVVRMAATMQAALPEGVKAIRRRPPCPP